MTASRGVLTRDRNRIRSLVHRATRTDKGPPVEQKSPAVRDNTRCERCGAGYRRKNWHHPQHQPDQALGAPIGGLCPACRQESRGEGFGRVRTRGAFALEHEDEIRRRVRNVSERARSNQPERRLVSIDRDATGLDIVTTSQRLAHRIARELTKVFAGQAVYHWDDRDGALLVVWERHD